MVAELQPRQPLRHRLSYHHVLSRQRWRPNLSRWKLHRHHLPPTTVSKVKSVSATTFSAGSLICLVLAGIQTKGLNSYGHRHSLRGSRQEVDLRPCAADRPGGDCCSRNGLCVGMRADRACGGCKGPLVSSMVCNRVLCLPSSRSHHHCGCDTCSPGPGRIRYCAMSPMRRADPSSSFSSPILRRRVRIRDRSCAALDGGVS
jgi:hypothetical protein